MLQETRQTLMLICLALGVSSTSFAAIPIGYYDSVNTESAQTLRGSLHQIINDHQRFPYTSSATDTWDILEQADENPDDKAQIISIYTNRTYPKAGGGNSHYNREHAWPKSYGFPDNGSDNYPYTDAHHLFLADSGYNSSRNNKPYAECDSGCAEKVTTANHNRGGDDSESNWTIGSGFTGSWETWSERKGDTARALMYLAVRYEGGTHSVTGKPEPDLRLTDNRTLIGQSNTGDNLSIAYMGLRSTLIQWHKDDPVDDFERRHNDTVYSYQGNRNPFIDHPEYVICVFENNCSGTNSALDISATSPSNVWINELHYDNSGTDQNEFVEIAGTANSNLDGWILVAYNGNNGKPYKTTLLSGTISNQQNGFGTLSFNISGLQNGSADGLALINDKGSVIQFLSYEGTLTATSGEANGLTSIDINVSETSSTRLGYSLQLSGTGQNYNDFIWKSAVTSTAGSLNNGQSF
ncbi:endonuclease [uncultured Paraglaciecola sp.]|uniref:endonuclease n=1 Tax=uncultured Paraglaciecola sp. TaxID=1765024 RepID=UPI0025941B8D|nr:endonuclease [uncultured Paraglaciecola sp.]